MIAALHSGLGSLKSLFGWRRPRTLPAQPRDRQEARASATTAGHGPAACVHADLALRRFTAYSLGASLGDLSGPADARHDMELLESARRALRKLELQPKYLPRRPSLLPRLMSAISSDGNSMRDLAKIIADDGALLGGLLRLANSSFYRPNGGRQIASLEKAVTLVGTDGIRSLVTTALLHPVMTAGRGPFASFPEITWDHSQHAAAAAELHAQQIERVDPFGARLLVLLYGLAINTVFRIVRDECLSGAALVRPVAMVQLLDEWAAPTAIRIAEKWQLPAALIQALAEPRADGLARSLRFGRLAGALLLLANRGHLRELSARAIVLADDVRRAQVDRLWTRLATTYLVATR